MKRVFDGKQEKIKTQKVQFAKDSQKQTNLVGGNNCSCRGVCGDSAVALAVAAAAAAAVVH